MEWNYKSEETENVPQGTWHQVGEDQICVLFQCSLSSRQPVCICIKEEDSAPKPTQRLHLNEGGEKKGVPLQPKVSLQSNFAILRKAFLTIF